MMASHLMRSFSVWAEAPMKAYNGFSVFREPEGGKKTSATGILTI